MDEKTAQRVKGSSDYIVYTVILEKDDDQRAHIGVEVVNQLIDRIFVKLDLEQAINFLEGIEDHIKDVHDEQLLGL